MAWGFDSPLRYHFNEGEKNMKTKKLKNGLYEIEFDDGSKLKYYPEHVNIFGQRKARFSFCIRSWKVILIEFFFWRLNPKNFFIVNPCQKCLVNSCCNEPCKNFIKYRDFQGGFESVFLAKLYLSLIYAGFGIFMSAIFLS